MATATPIPMICAWAQLGLHELSHGPIIWGGEFELRGASGFQAQERLYGVCGVIAEVELGADIRFKVQEGDTIDIWAIESRNTKPSDLSPYCNIITASFKEAINTMIGSRKD